jgi:hypothetical protein
MLAETLSHAIHVTATTQSRTHLDEHFAACGAAKGKGALGHRESGISARDGIPSLDRSEVGTQEDHVEKRA